MLRKPNQNPGSLILLTKANVQTSAEFNSPFYIRLWHWERKKYQRIPMDMVLTVLWGLTSPGSTGELSGHRKTCASIIMTLTAIATI